MRGEIELSSLRKKIERKENPRAAILGFCLIIFVGKFSCNLGSDIRNFSRGLSISFCLRIL